MATLSVIADVPPMLDATEPPEARGLRRDAVRLLVSDVTSDSVAHATFADLPRYLSPGDLIVVNTSGTLNAALSATTSAGEDLALHLSTRMPGGFWVVELRERRDGADGLIQFVREAAGHFLERRGTRNQHQLFQQPRGLRWRWGFGGIFSGLVPGREHFAMHVGGAQAVGQRQHHPALEIVARLEVAALVRDDQSDLLVRARVDDAAGCDQFG